MKKLFKYCEFLFFGLINVFFGLGILIIPFIFSLFIQNGESFDKHIIAYLLLMFLVWQVYLFFKIFILPLLYWLKILFPNIHNFLSKIENKKGFRTKLLMSVLISDSIVFLVIFSLSEFDWKIVYPYLIFGGGILPCYLVFILLEKAFKPISFLFRLKK